MHKGRLKPSLSSYWGLESIHNPAAQRGFAHPIQGNAPKRLSVLNGGAFYDQSLLGLLK
jgi:hypothetical protein